VISYTPFTRYNRLYNRFDNRLYTRYSGLSNPLSNGFDNRSNVVYTIQLDNRLYRVYKHSTGCDTTNSVLLYITIKYNDVQLTQCCIVSLKEELAVWRSDNALVSINEVNLR